MVFAVIMLWLWGHLISPDDLFSAANFWCAAYYRLKLTCLYVNDRIHIALTWKRTEHTIYALISFYTRMRAHYSVHNLLKRIDIKVIVSRKLYIIWLVTLLFRVNFIRKGYMVFSNHFLVDIGSNSFDTATHNLIQLCSLKHNTKFTYFVRAID